MSEVRRRFPEERRKESVRPRIIQLQPTQGSRGTTRFTKPNLLYAIIVVGLALISVVFLGEVLGIHPRIRAHRHMLTQKGRVVVIGGGLAGLSAVAEALLNHAKVTLVDKPSSLGGNSIKATSGINAVGTRAQQLKNINDSVNLFVEEIVKSGKGKTQPILAKILASHSRSALEDFLNDTLHLDLSSVEKLGGHSQARTHRFPVTADGKILPVGWTLIKTLSDFIKQEKFAENLEILSGWKLDDFTLLPSPLGMEHPMVSGLTISRVSKEGEPEETRQIDGSAVVLAAGGFSADRGEDSILNDVAPKWMQDMPTTNGPWTTGDILKIAKKKRLAVVDLSEIQLHPTGFVDIKNPNKREKFLCPEVARSVGGLLIGSDGKRFVDELESRDTVSAAIIDHGASLVEWGIDFCTDGTCPSQRVAVLLLDGAAVSRFGPSSVNFYKSMNLLHHAGSYRAAAESLHIQPDSLLSAIHDIDEKHPYWQGGKKHISLDDDIGVVFGYVTPSIHYTMGGLGISPTGRVARVDEHGAEKTVVNLFSAGESTGGLHGKNRLGGNGLLESIVFGRMAGRQAALMEPPKPNDNVFPIEGELLVIDPEGCLIVSPKALMRKMDCPFVSIRQAKATVSVRCQVVTIEPDYMKLELVNPSDEGLVGLGYVLVEIAHL